LRFIGKFRVKPEYLPSLCEANPGFWNEVDRLIEEGYGREKKKD
jgi:hypothetical protein